MRYAAINKPVVPTGLGPFFRDTQDSASPIRATPAQIGDPATSWANFPAAPAGLMCRRLRDNATESLAHAQEAGEMIMRLHRRPALGIAALPSTRHNTIDQILSESIEREESGVELYRELLALVKDKSVVLEEYATRLVAAEAVHLREMELMLMKGAPD